MNGRPIQVLSPRSNRAPLMMSQANVPNISPTAKMPNTLPTCSGPGNAVISRARASVGTPDPHAETMAPVARSAGELIMAMSAGPRARNETLALRRILSLAAAADDDEVAALRLGA